MHITSHMSEFTVRKPLLRIKWNAPAVSLPSSAVVAAWASAARLPAGRLAAVMMCAAAADAPMARLEAAWEGAEPAAELGRSAVAVAAGRPVLQGGCHSAVTCWIAGLGGTVLDAEQ
jgi:hypothetical protein